ncbi:hypothetical protein J4573_51640 [Actinomadura barringtoniae]|uniref:Alpha/beta hydrolase domain-containing protein n=1 Tax=Actinomadura barringtoniae TaxID=1427535 RepID=A0A939PST7_9ACTN|nr:alpha/beta hydrolase domain-containing protein [Actinomadura barringtoniae]MBO2455609.1 hypothetical protein [Actinomadura barringtoniae]
MSMESPHPTVDGPVPGPIWFAAAYDLAAAGYVEEEFLLTGGADAYSLESGLGERGVPYTTRLLVRRPAGPARFNGNVVVEWLNVTEGFDSDVLWHPGTLVAEGYAWVGVSAQRAGVDHLRDWNPDRYAGLDVSGAARFESDELAFSILTQAAQVLRKPSGVDPLGGLRPQALLAIGISQSASWLSIYHDLVLPALGLDALGPDADDPFDGYLFVAGPGPTRSPTVPVFQILSETDVPAWWPSRPSAGPDLPAGGELSRRWEVAGTTHADWATMSDLKVLHERDLGTPLPLYDEDAPVFSRVPMHHVIEAAYGHLSRWARDGVAPPLAEPLALTADGANVRDDLGLARGGIQLSQVAVPIALNSSENPGDPWGLLCGTYRPFGEEKLRELYPSLDAYVAAVEEADQRNVAAGYILPEHARQNLADAKAVTTL